jgi:hypothetical protein
VAANAMEVPMTRRFWGVTGRVLALVLTSYCLIATSETYVVEPPQPQFCDHAMESITFQVGGDCGAAGRIVVMSPADECLVSVQGAAEVGLPSEGHFDSFAGTKSVNLSTSGWTLTGSLTGSPSETRSCVHTIQYHLGTIDSEQLVCTDGHGTSCTAELTRL